VPLEGPQKKHLTQLRQCPFDLDFVHREGPKERIRPNHFSVVVIDFVRPEGSNERIRDDQTVVVEKQRRRRSAAAGFGALRLERYQINRVTLRCSNVVKDPRKLCLLSAGLSVGSLVTGSTWENKRNLRSGS
jgi:hypothetical protein